MAWSLRPVFARKLFDISWRLIIRGIITVVTSHNDDHASEEAAADRLDELWAPSQTIATLSVRSALDLLLQVCAFPPGSEIIVSAVTIPDMIRIIEIHGLIPVPVDLQAMDASVSAGDVAIHITTRTKAILVAQLFGACRSLAAVAALAQQHHLLLIEDCAQAFRGRDFVGSSDASVSMFCFGSTKTCTALGGALITVRERKLFQGMRSIMATYPQQKRKEYCWKFAKYAGFKAVTQNPYSYGILIVLLGGQEGKHHATITKLSHSLSTGLDLLPQIRLRPSVALMRFLHRRVSEFDPSSLEERAVRVATVAKRLPTTMQPVGFSQPTASDSNHHYWIFPIRVAHPRDVLNDLLAAGFDAAAGNASLVVVQKGSVTRHIYEGKDKDYTLTCPTPNAMMSSIIYLPVDHVFTPKLTQRPVVTLVERNKGFRYDNVEPCEPG